MLAGVPRRHRYPPLGLLGPLVEIQTPERVLLSRDLLRPLRRYSHLLERSEITQGWIRLLPDSFIEPIRIPRRFVDDREECRIETWIGRNLLRVVVQLPQD